MSFLWPWSLLCLLLLPLLILYYRRLLVQRQQTAVTLGTLGIVQNRSGQEFGRRRHLPPAIFLLGLTLIIIGLARPEMAVSLPRVEGTVILAFDVSNSMLAADLEPTRIEAAKAAARAFVENQPDTVLVGVVAFSNGGLVVLPPTDVPADLLAAIDRLTPQGGTSLGQGIFTALTAIAGEAVTLDEAALAEGLPRLEMSEIGSAVIVLLTDGENTGPPEPLTVAQVAAEAGVRIYPIGIGSSEGAVLEVDGFSILTQLNETSLQEIASLTNGTYYQAADEAALQEIYENIDLRLVVRGEKMEVTALFAVIGLLLWLIGGALSMLWLGHVP
jgi:Ca-activated chloride channel family protein